MIQELKEIPLKSIFPNTFMFLLSDSLLEIKLKAKVKNNHTLKFSVTY